MQLLEKATNRVKGVVYSLFVNAGIERHAGPILTLLEFSYTVLSKFNFGRNATQFKLNKYVSDFKANTKLSAQQNEKLVAVVTGANSGVGYETAKALGLAGYQVIMACRNHKLADKAIISLRGETGLDNFRFMELNLSSFDSIKKFVDSFKAEYSKLNLLVNNAGVMMCPYMTTEDGLEMQVGTNHVGHFMLTSGLLEEIKAAKRARIVVLASTAQFRSNYEKSLILDSSKYNKVTQYGLSKLANVMFTTELAKRLQGTGVTVNAVHPGIVNTNLARHLEITKSSVVQHILSLLLLTPAAGSLTSVKVALSPDLEGATGKYFEHEHEATCKVEGNNPALCVDLWGYTEELIAKFSK
ncbi:Retinol dehydrogenase 14 [Zancudomyces culisetae]|uniref:Retinol dehydrogenase 14 n=1 Tax=Zancudomyces culisetae TaxID=1213189 RepID=A0A1R1PYI0_ZANCU|nr:Retinol dehydrogenase 14 [Zancudomyces culisetae]|eukprot:OMH86010.1 Retinol dehydrogenase 14 [Zancudomyces culisetae]